MIKSIIRTVIAGFLVNAGGCVSSDTATLQRFEFSQAQMGLDFTITLYAREKPAARTAATDAFRRIGELNGILSDYDADSELSRLSQSSGTGDWIKVSPELGRVLTAAQRIARQSAGAFDITVGPSVNLWRRARRLQQLPAEALLTAMRQRVGYTNLQLDPGPPAARLRKAGMRLDAGGIAKGFALDEALAILRKSGHRRAMIHAGGDMVFGDPPPGRAAWNIELPNPGGEDTVAIAQLHNCALATSGDLVQFVEIDGVRYSHIVDPRTGIGMTNRSLVQVIAPDGITADSLSTAISVLGPEAGLGLVAKNPKTSCQVTEGLATERRVTRSKGFASHLAEP